MRIPVFVSCPSALSKKQEKSRGIVAEELANLDLEWRALGRDDFPTVFPLREVLVLARHCAGGVILGFEQIYASKATKRRGTPERKSLKGVRIPSAWNHLESGILFTLGLPLLVFCEDGVCDGIFDHGVSDAFVHKMPPPSINPSERRKWTAVFQKWQAAVRYRYYQV
jgi:hypothetical protein